MARPYSLLRFALDLFQIRQLEQRLAQNGSEITHGYSIFQV